MTSYAAYLLVRRTVWNDRGRARAARNAARVVDLERRCGVLVEPAVQAAADRAPRLVAVLNVWYAVANVTLSIGWVLRLYLARDTGYQRERRAVVAAWAAALPVFATFPLAPPRKVEGFIDTFLARGIDLERPALVRWYNPIAAMPSHHVAFAVVTGRGLGRRAHSPLGQAAWYAYPALVAATVVVTGNHYVADVALGATLGAAARAITR